MGRFIRLTFAGPLRRMVPAIFQTAFKIFQQPECSANLGALVGIPALEKKFFSADGDSNCASHFL